MRSLRKLLTEPAGRLGAMLQHARALSELDRQIKPALPPPLRPHCSVASVSADTLILHASSPVWNARLRYLVPSILEQARKLPGLHRLKSVRVKVALEHRTEAPTPRLRPRSASAGSAECLRRCAEAINDPALKAVLLRLAKHAPTRT